MRVRHTVCFTCEQSVDHDGLGLSDAVCTRLGLQVVLRIPVTGGSSRIQQRARGERRTICSSKSTDI